MTNKKSSSSTIFLTALLTTMIIFLPSSSSSVFAQTNATTTTTDTTNNDTSTATTPIPSLPQNMTGQSTMMKEEADNNKSDIMHKEYKKYDTLNATVNIEQAMFHGIASSINVTLTEAINTAEQSIGNNSFAMYAKGEEKNGFIIYSIVLATPDMNFHKVTVDPGNGEVLKSEDISKMEWMMIMHSDKEAKDKRMHDGGYGQDKGMKGMHDGGYGQDKGMKGMHDGGYGQDKGMVEEYSSYDYEYDGDSGYSEYSEYSEYQSGR